MVNFCAIIGCSNNAKKSAVSFYRLPAVITTQGERTLELSEKKRQTWLSRISRDIPKTSQKYTRVCSEHFVSGKPADLYNESDIDWAPSVNLGHTKKIAQQTPDRGLRNRERHSKKKRMETAQSLISLSLSTNTPSPEPECELEELDPVQDETEGTASQTDLEGGLMFSMENELNRLIGENVDLKTQLTANQISEDMFRHNDDKVKLFTGLPGFSVLMTVFMLIEPHLPLSHNSALTKFQQMMLVFMRLKMNLPVLYVADRFGISTGTVSKVFANTLNVFYKRLKRLVYWPSTDELRKTMPVVFRKDFGLKVTVIIDCFEIFTDRPSNLMARAQTWSSYKHHNTVKYLIGIAPQGSISFLSKGYGGRVSDKFVTNDCGLLDKLGYGDIVLADRGFDIADSVAQVSAEVKIPASTKGKSQLAALDVEQTRKIAHVRIHVERVIGLVRNKYKILQDTLPLDYFHSHDNSTTTIDKIVTVCCALTNLCKSVVPFN
ncbi:uncharacterized protein [Argopecten irradians]|uniref:uncharacterized protein n=1 Tax=Argopecten irradians TaxID=31199 RepID=UPI00371779E2